MEFSCAVKVWGSVYAMAPFLFDDESLKTLSCFLTSVANHGHFEQLRFGKRELRDFSGIFIFFWKMYISKANIRDLFRTVSLPLDDDIIDQVRL